MEKFFEKFSEKLAFKVKSNWNPPNGHPRNILKQT